MRSRIDIDHALVDSDLLGAALGNLTPWKVWRIVLRAAFALGLGTEEERSIFEEISGARPPPAKRVRELWAGSLGAVANPAWRQRGVSLRCSCRAIWPLARWAR